VSAVTRLRIKVATIATLVREGEILRPLLLSANAVPPSVLRVYVFVITQARSILALRAPTDVRFRRLRPGEPLDRLPARDGEDPELLRGSLLKELGDGRHELFAAETDSGIVAYTCVARRYHDIPEVRLRLALGADEACTYRSYVEPAHRYSWVYAGLAAFVFTQLHSCGISSFVGYANFANRHSIRTHERLGYHRAGWACLVRMPFLDLQITHLDWHGEGVRFRVLRHVKGQAREAVGETSYSPRTTN
jgi:GNAT superfamily N-acetyltransferase